MEWSGVEWCGVVWCGVVWCEVRRGEVRGEVRGDMRSATVAFCQGLGIKARAARDVVLT